MFGPIMLMYQLDPFHQNHRRYAQSWSYAQLTQPGTVPYATVADSCYPVVNEGNDARRDPDVPCGLAARTYFNDTFRLYGPGDELVPWTKVGIARDASRLLYSKLPADPAVTRDGFAAWVRAATLPRFRKAYARLERDLAPGRYTVEVHATFDVSSFGGSASFLLTTVGWFGGRHHLLAWLALTLALALAAMGALAHLTRRDTPLQLRARQLERARSMSNSSALGAFPPLDPLASHGSRSDLYYGRRSGREAVLLAGSSAWDYNEPQAQRRLLTRG